ncbi:MAG: hypothetical protein WEB04_07520 [Dehalococcoidia bacterium]
MEHRLPSIGFLLAVTAAGLLAVASLACSETPSQLRAVKRLTSNGELMQIACFDVNDDGKVNAGDADTSKLPDFTGDGKVDEAETNIVSAVEMTVAQGKPANCNRGDTPDWLVTEAPVIDCSPGQTEVLLYGVGGGAVDLKNPTNAAGVRWMMYEIGKQFDAAGLPHQILSVAPGLNGQDNGQPASEDWSTAYLTEELNRVPCMRLVLLGHSHGGTHVTAVASRLEAAGLADRITLNILIDRVADLYSGDATSLPQQSTTVNYYLPANEQYHGVPFEQTNFENVDVSGEVAPEGGEQGGKILPAVHTTIDNSPSLLDKIEARIAQALSNAASTPTAAP